VNGDAQLVSLFRLAPPITKAYSPFPYMFGANGESEWVMYDGRSVPRSAISTCDQRKQGLADHLLLATVKVDQDRLLMGLYEVY
jgi:hypothetical protein